MSRALSGNEKCVFCGWTRRNAYQTVRFFCIPKEPGLKRVRWLQVFGEREITAKDRVCSVHFRSGRPSSDASHEDFVPHLYLNNEPPPEVIEYLESLADAKPERTSPRASATPTSSGTNSKPLTGYAPPGTHSHSMIKSAVTRSSKPSILKRKRRPGDAKRAESPKETTPDPQLDAAEDSSPPPLVRAPPFEEESRPVKLTLIQRQIADAVGLKPGQTVIIRRVLKKPS